MLETLRRVCHCHCHCHLRASYTSPRTVHHSAQNRKPARTRQRNRRRHLSRGLVGAFRTVSAGRRRACRSAVVKNRSFHVVRVHAGVLRTCAAHPTLAMSHVWSTCMWRTFTLCALRQRTRENRSHAPQVETPTSVPQETRRRSAVTVKGAVSVNCHGRTPGMSTASQTART